VPDTSDNWIEDEETPSNDAAMTSARSATPAGNDSAHHAKDLEGLKKIVAAQEKTKIFLRLRNLVERMAQSGDYE